MPDDARSQVFAAGMLDGQVALVTGGGTGLGKATALELARCGAKVVVAGRRAEVLREAVAEIRARIEAHGVGVGVDGPDTTAGPDGAGAGGAADWVAGDVREPADARRLIQTTLERHGRLDMLVNNAGGQYYTPAEGIVAKGWRAVWRLNVEGMLNMAESAVECGLGGARAGEEGLEEEGKEEGKEGKDGMGARPRAHTRWSAIVNVTLSPHHGMPGMAHSGAARAAVEALTRELAARWADRDIAVVAVAAGHYDTEAMAKYPDAVRAGMARSVPLQRLGRPEEHAWLVALLCSRLGRALSGSTVTLDGARDNWFGPWPPPGLTGQTGEVPTEERRGAGPV
jgi:citronellol/citronellal dehydrogenase